MSHYLVETAFLRKNGSQLPVQIHFEYFIPPLFQDWQDKAHGNIQILQLLHSGSKEPIIDLQLEEMIGIRRICWDYLEEKKLLLSPNVVSMFSR
ncbi:MULTISPECIES: hypothetical protein [Legionella]|uniref:Uncharacterized protein n=1 Tax=Legionella drozanskii LLAP-1 TaxID=1212489 RepID=A0A0W0SM90_9GAMM|nr:MULTISPECIES: hypothetical protein [Legionella]KTC84428.1 hypothetical protein Ldro_3031 [Legionella drozanskii LLAP-1]PJE05789.1 MAG: hypothetical protein CK430_15360 [Legionella sp.]